ncbi:MAG: hypothetical protein ACRDHW_21800, partial [Ktedonobacteraceae bacterium]
DPAGASMPVAMSRKLEYFVRSLGLDLDIKLFPVVLTYAQTKHYTRLLPTPIKDSERRKEKFEAKYGQGAIELDALEALYPGEMERILRREMAHYYDSDLVTRMEKAKWDIRVRLSKEQAAIHTRYQNEIQQINGEWDEVKTEIQALLARHVERRAAIWHDIETELDVRKPDVSTDDIPEAEEADERPGALYDSQRDYLEQNTVYQAHKRHMSNSAIA